MILAAVGFVLLLALLIRIAAVRQLSLQVDEPATILAAHQVAERGVPILPSGTLYLHGATLSYLLAPLVWLGVGDLDDLRALRLVGVVAGVVAVGLTYLLASRIGGVWVGILAAFLLALDATSVQWSAHLRMYALLQALTLVVILLYLSLLTGSPRRGTAVWLVVTFWLATFTHVGVALLWPAMAIVAVVALGRALWGERRVLAIALACCLSAPLTYAALNRAVQPQDYREPTGSSFFSFAGEGLFNLERFQAPVPVAWGELFGRGYANDFLPYVVVAIAGMLVGRLFLGRASRRRRSGRGAADQARGGDRLVMLAALMAILVVSVLGVSAFTLDQEPRYLLHVHPIDYVLLAVGLAALLGEIRLPAATELLPTWRRWLPVPALVGLTLVVTLGVVADGLAVRFREPVVGPDQIAALEYVASHGGPGDLVITYLTPAPYLVFGGRENLAFLAGDRQTVRVARYTRQTDDGRTVDYWVGADSITSTAELCRVLLMNRGAWLIVDEQRMRGTWAYGGAIAETILRTTTLVAATPGGSLIFRGWTPSLEGSGPPPSCGGATPGQRPEEPLAQAPDPGSQG